LINVNASPAHVHGNRGPENAHRRSTSLIVDGAEKRTRA